MYMLPPLRRPGPRRRRASRQTTALAMWIWHAVGVAGCECDMRVLNHRESSSGIIIGKHAKMYKDVRYETLFVS